MRGVATDPSKRPGDILVIDDDAILRDLVTDWLEGAGYRVRRAASCCAGTAEGSGEQQEERAIDSPAGVWNYPPLFQIPARRALHDSYSRLSHDRRLAAPVRVRRRW